MVIKPSESSWGQQGRFCRGKLYVPRVVPTTLSSYLGAIAVFFYILLRVYMYPSRGATTRAQSGTHPDSGSYLWMRAAG